MNDTVLLEKDGRIGRITLNRPDVLNAIDGDMPQAIADRVAEANADDEIHVIILSGAGRAFCAGYDLTYYASSQEGDGHALTQDMPWDPMQDYAFMHRNTELFMSLWHSHKPVIAKVSGFAAAGGSDIALCCDMIVMADDAEIGYMPARVWGCPTTAMWTYRVGPEQAKRLLFTGDRINVDFTGTSEQIPKAINCTFTYTFAMVSYAVKSALLPDVPNNDGIFRCMEVTAPEGSIVNPRRPVSVGGRMATGHYLPALVFQALAPVLPDKVMAACGSPLWSIVQTGIDKRGRTYANTLFFNGGMGALPTKPGESCYSWPSNISNVPVELVERNTPLFIHSKSLREGSGGTGVHPGGEGQEMVFESESETPVGIIFMAERLKFAAKGLEGGGEGALGEVLIDNKPADARADHALNLGQTITLRTPGGGGYGKA